MSDIVERLREIDSLNAERHANSMELIKKISEIMRAKNETIDGLRAELAEARELVRSTSETAQKHLASYLDAQDQYAEARPKAFEEAAEVAEDRTRNYSPGTFNGLRDNIAQAIRAMITPLT